MPAVEAGSVVNFHDPLIRHCAMHAKGISLDAFLITLAAFQRGLQVVFHYERASYDLGFRRAKLQGHRGEIFSISDGKKTHVFSRTMGDLVKQDADVIAEDKHLSKRMFAQKAVATPKGVVVFANQMTLIKKFMVNSGASAFVIKPLKGSLAKGVVADLSAESVVELCQTLGDKRILLEEYVAGREFRATVVGDACVAVSERTPLFVVGDGKSSIEKLFEANNARRRMNPYLGAINFNQDIIDYLSRHHLNKESVPALNEKVQLLNTTYGVDHTDVTAAVPDAVKTIAVKATRAIDLPNAGVDVILKPDGAPVVLEVNQRSYIGSHSFPSYGSDQGNRVAEAIVDHYFPESKNNQRFSHLIYDFSAVLSSMQSAQLASVALPVVNKDWVVKRITLGAGRSLDEVIGFLQLAAQSTGLMFVHFHDTKQAKHHVSIAGSSVCYKKFEATIPASLKNKGML